MTFTSIKTRIMSHCGLTSTDADTRVGIAINQHYRRVTASLGIDPVRFVTRNASTTNGVQTVTFTEIEQIDRVLDTTDSTNVRTLTKVSLDEIRTSQPGTGQPGRWALDSTTSDDVVIILDTLPQTTYSLEADGASTLGDMSGTDEPIFAESFHDILSFLVIAEELLKKEKIQLAREFASGDENRPGRAETAIRDLRFKLAEMTTADLLQQGSRLNSTAGTGAAGGSGNAGGTAYTQTALITFDRDPSAPFAVTSGSAKVDNLDADKLDGFDESAFAKLADNETVTGAYTFSGIANTGLKVLDTNASHSLTIKPGSDITAARTLTFTTGDADRTITYSGNPTLADWFDQSVKAAATPTFAGASFGSNTLSGALSFAGIANTGLKVLDTNASHVLSIVPGSDITANRTLTITTGDAARTVTLSGDPTLNDWFDQSVKVAATPTFGATTITGALTISGASAGQIVFPATQNASGGANTLDDYEENSWTPTIASAGGGTPTYSAQTGGYVKVGQLVYAWADVTLASKGTLGAGQIRIASLPFTSASSSSMPFVVGYFTAMSTSVVWLGGHVTAGGTTGDFYHLTAAGTGVSATQVSDVGTTWRVMLSLVYRASA